LKVDYYAIYRIMVITKVDTDPIDSISAGPMTRCDTCYNICRDLQNGSRTSI
jgi:hypothetical protein